MAPKRPRRGRKSDGHRDRSLSTKLQIVFAFLVLAMVLAFGTDLSDGAAGCFYSLSDTPNETTPKTKSPVEPTGTTTVRFTEPDSKSESDTKSESESASTPDAKSQPPADSSPEPPNAATRPPTP